MSEWISVNDKKPKGKCLVVLEEEVACNKMHTAFFKDNIEIIGSAFAWDMPKITHWMPLPEPPK